MVWPTLGSRTAIQKERKERKKLTVMSPVAGYLWAVEDLSMPKPTIDVWSATDHA